MNQRIIYQNDNGGMSVIIPTQEALDLYGIEAIALKDVPRGKPFKIVDASEISTDRTKRDEWKIDAGQLTDGVGADYSTFPKA